MTAEIAYTVINLFSTTCPGKCERPHPKRLNPNPSLIPPMFK